MPSPPLTNAVVLEHSRVDAENRHLILFTVAAVVGGDVSHAGACRIVVEVEFHAAIGGAVFIEREPVSLFDEVERISDPPTVETLHDELFGFVERIAIGNAADGQTVDGELGAFGVNGIAFGGQNAEKRIITFRAKKNGAIGAIRTRDLLLRRQLLYPAELQPHVYIKLYIDKLRLSKRKNFLPFGVGAVIQWASEVIALNWKLTLAILSCNVLFMSSSYTMIIPFLPMYLTRELGVDRIDVNMWSGVIFSSTFFVSAIMAPIWGRLADTKGKRLMAIRSSLLISISYFIGGIVETPLQLTLMRAFMGFAAGLWPMDLAIMSLVAPKEKLGFCLGIMSGTLTAGGVIGPLIGGFLATNFGMRVSFFIASTALFINCLMFVFLIKEPRGSTDTKVDEAQEELKPWKIPAVRILLICGTLTQMFILILQPILTTYVTELVGEVDDLVMVAGAVFSLGGVAGALSAPLWGRFGQRRGFYLSMAIGMCGAGIFTFTQGFAGGIVTFALLQFAGGLFFSAIPTSIQASLAQSTPVEYKGRMFGWLFTFQQVGSILGPLLGGAIASFLGMGYVFFIAGSILISMSLVIRHKYLINR